MYNVNGCLVGVLNDTPDTSSHHRWKCEGQNGGRADFCNRIIVEETTTIDPPDTRVTVGRTKDSINRSQLVINVTGTHFMFRFTHSVEGPNTDCEWGTPNAYHWFELFGPRGPEWETRDWIL